MSKNPIPAFLKTGRNMLDTLEKDRPYGYYQTDAMPGIFTQPDGDAGLGTLEPGPAKRDNSGKPEMDYILNWPKAVEAVARVSEMGARKYGRCNFKKGGKPNHEYYGCAMRHLFKAHSGEDFDSESGGLHLAHAIWNLMTLIEMNWEGDLYDPTRDLTQQPNKKEETL